MALLIAPGSVDEPDVADLVGLHHADMAALSPDDSMHALDAAGLRHPSLTLFAARADGALVAIGALKRLTADEAELKSMRVADAYRGTGAGRTLLRHLVSAAQADGIRTLWLETGSDEAWLAARRLYASEGFVECGPFTGYVPDRHSTFMTRELQTGTTSATA